MPLPHEYGQNVSSTSRGRDIAGMMESELRMDRE